MKSNILKTVFALLFLTGITLSCERPKDNNAPLSTGIIPEEIPEWLNVKILEIEGEEHNQAFIDQIKVKIYAGIWDEDVFYVIRDNYSTRLTGNVFHSDGTEIVIFNKTNNIYKSLYSEPEKWKLMHEYGNGNVPEPYLPGSLPQWLADTITEKEVMGSNNEYFNKYCYEVYKIEYATVISYYMIDVFSSHPLWCTENGEPFYYDPKMGKVVSRSLIYKYGWGFNTVKLPDELPEWLQSKIQEIEAESWNQTFERYVKVKVYGGVWGNQLIYIIRDNYSTQLTGNIFHADGTEIKDFEKSNSIYSNLYGDPEQWELMHEYGSGKSIPEPYLPGIFPQWLVNHLANIEQMVPRDGSEFTISSYRVYSREWDGANIYLITDVLSSAGPILYNEYGELISYPSGAGTYLAWDLIYAYGWNFQYDTII